ncbi:gamma carbonic anhydrase family protein [Candidatus Mesenet endosymbiont of Phosphuga atrata]|uniref:gamma carbonic anhydrase family protein n=1 Tax=Candidatus Mesenet endosymbiont of Phosphuga atrata TaxID=3066221 RepID=UPI0030D02C83
MASIVRYEKFLPKIGEGTFIAKGVYIVGKVEIGKNVSVWYNSVLRGDVGSIYIGDGSNVQDGTIIHVDRVGGDTKVGSMVTIGHGCILHACTVCDRVLIGMGSIIMNNATIESNSIIAAGSLVTEGKIVKSGEVWAGRPAKLLRKILQEEIENINISAANYIELSKQYMENDG